MRRVVLTIIFVFIVSLNLSTNQDQPELNVIYGDHHIFTIETPDGWINDKNQASSIGLVSFFYSKADSQKQKKSYFYAMGYDKESPEDSMDDFIKGDINNFKNKYPELTYKTIKMDVSGEILNAVLYSFDNLSDRYKEEVVYMETEYSIFVFPFSANSRQEYLDYQPIFDNFLKTFNYRGNDSKPFLDWQKQNHQ